MAADEALGKAAENTIGVRADDLRSEVIAFLFRQALELRAIEDLRSLSLLRRRRRNLQLTLEPSFGYLDHRRSA